MRRLLLSLSSDHLLFWNRFLFSNHFLFLDHLFYPYRLLSPIYVCFVFPYRLFGPKPLVSFLVPVARSTESAAVAAIPLPHRLCCAGFVTTSPGRGEDGARTSIAPTVLEAGRTE
jgi:hypothetical protein